MLGTVALENMESVVDRLVEEHDKKLAALDAALARGVADADAGRVRDADEVFDELRRRYLGKPERSTT